MKLADKVLQLIELKKEGKTWDFKDKWYTSKALLLHDILNMANNETYEDSFIIIGVDENNNFSLVDIKEDSNRYNQIRLNNLLRSPKIKFAGDNVPNVKLETIDINGYSIDVIIIKSTDNVPYYLTDNYVEKNTSSDVKKEEIIIYASKIYVRRNDSNTPINKCATDNEIEQLWKKRFGIDLSVQEKFTKLLSNKEDWESYNEVYFHKFNPDFTFRTVEQDCSNQYIPASYSYEQSDSRQHTHILQVFFRNINIGKYRVDWLDGGRMSYVYPNMDYITLPVSRAVYSYLYFIKDDIKSKLNKIFLDLNENSEHKFIFNIIKKYVVFFEDELEKNEFHKYLQNNIKNVFEESKKMINDYSYIKVPEGLVKEKVIEELCLQKIIVKIFNNNKEQK